MPQLHQHLEAALSACSRADYAEAIDELLAAWAMNRSPAIASVADLLDLCALGFELKPLDSVDIGGFLAASPLQRGQWLRRFALTQGEIPDPQPWLDALAKAVPDPRVAAVLFDVSYRVPLAYADDEEDSEDESLDMEDPIVIKFREVCSRHLDRRVLGVGHGEPKLRPLLPDTLEGDWEMKLLNAELELRRRLFDDAEDRKAVAAFAKDPTDPAARQAYAGWLDGRGDPRGAQLKTESVSGTIDFSSLWLGPIENAVHASISKGWVEQIQFRDPPLPKWYGRVDFNSLEIGWRPGWAGIRRLIDPPAEFLTAVRFPNLEMLYARIGALEKSLEAGAALASVPFLKIRNWNLSKDSPGTEDTERVQSLLRQPGLKGVRKLALHYYSQEKKDTQAVVTALTPLLSDPCGLEELRMDQWCKEWGWVSTMEWLTALRATLSPLRIFRARCMSGEAWTFEHSSDRSDWQKLRVEWTNSSPSVEYHLVNKLELVAKAGAKAVELISNRELLEKSLETLRRLPLELKIQVDPKLTCLEED